MSGKRTGTCVSLQSFEYFSILLSAYVMCYLASIFSVISTSAVSGIEVFIRSVHCNAT